MCCNPLLSNSIVSVQVETYLLHCVQAKLAQLGPKDAPKPGEGPVSLPSGVPMAAVPAMPQPPKQDVFKVR